MPPDLLNLPSYRVLGVDENEHDYRISAESLDPPKECPHCHSVHLVRFGRRDQMVRDLPMHGKRVGLYIDTRRYRCQACAKTFYEALPDIDDKRLMTIRLTAWMGKQAIKRTFSSIADEVGCTEFTSRAVFSDYVNELERTTRFETPTWMGIDEIHLIKPRGVITNIQNNTIVELLKNRNKDTLINYLSNLGNKENIQYVAMDMWAPYRDACLTVLPQARIVIDKFHVVKMANEAMEKVRKGLRDRLTLKEKRGLMHDRCVLLKREHDLTDGDSLLLSGWLKNYEELGLAYRLKEDFFKIYDCVSPDEAQGSYLMWKQRVTPAIAEAFHDLICAWDNWTPWVLEYFNHPVTSAYTESLNNLIRVMNRLGRGYSFEALRAKILFAEGARKRLNTKPIRKNREMNGSPELGFALFCAPDAGTKARKPRPTKLEKSIQMENLELNCGSDISTLVDLIKNGLL